LKNDSNILETSLGEDTASFSLELEPFFVGVAVPEFNKGVDVPGVNVPFFLEGLVAVLEGDPAVLGEFALPLDGRTNAANCLARLGKEPDAAPSPLCKGLGSFKFELLFLVVTTCH
jgi:hypothetical protein